MKENSARDIRSALLSLSRQLGRENLGLVILGEGNTSARVSEETFLVKASGASLTRMSSVDLVECRFISLLEALDKPQISDLEANSCLLASRVNGRTRKPSIEAAFHAYLLTLPRINYVAHTHPVSANQILCSSRAKAFATNRLFPDEIVTCGQSSVYVPYADPGFALAKAIRTKTKIFIGKSGTAPRVILLQNHGVVALGETWKSVLASTLMIEKAATIWVGASALGGPILLDEREVERIGRRPDEQLRRNIVDRLGRSSET